MKLTDITLADVSVETKVETLGVVLDKKLSEIDAQVSTVSKLIGPEGPKGEKGDKGAQGPQGVAGKDGKDGLNGKDGKDGKDGTAGKAGVSVVGASVALDGTLVLDLSDGGQLDVGEVVGPAGASGMNGAQGPIGLQGLAGAQGIQGATGLTGATGPQGIQGIQGVKGDTGDTGPAGATGTAGTNGTNGTNGVGVPVGGATGQVLAKINATDYNTQWITPNAGTVTSVTGTAPVVSSGGTTPAISMAQATNIVSGYLSSTDWSTFNGKQATLVSGTNIKTINGSTILGSGDLVVGGSFTGGTLTSQLRLAAGTTTAGTAPLKFVAGPVNTTAEAGAFEYDGNTFYSSVANSTRGVVPSEQMVVLTANNTLTSQTAAQPIFDGGGGPAGGAVTLPIGTYAYETSFCIASMSATSGSFGFAFGGTATNTFSFNAQAAKAGTALTTPMAIFSTCGTAAITTLVANSTGTVGQAVIRGMVRVTVAGTLIPQISLTSAAAAVIQANSYFKLSRIGNATVATVGNWS